MSKRCFMLCATFATLVVALVAFSTGMARADSRATISVDSPTAPQLPNDTFTVAVRVDSLAAGTSINGLDLLIEYDYTFMRLIDVQPGQLLTSCGWEYFNYRTAPPNFCRTDSCPDSRVHLVSLADIASQSGSPGCFIDQPGEIAILTFQVSHRVTPDCNYLLPIRFVWDDCTDNMVTLSTTLDTSLVSDRVFFFEHDVTDGTVFPGSGGAPNECVITGSASGNTARGIDFIGRGINLDCAPSLTSGAQISLIDDGEDNWIGRYAWVDVTVTDAAPGYELGSFDLTIKYDPSELTLANVEFIDPYLCNYASLDYRVGPNASCGGSPCPDGILRIRGIASDFQGGDPTCYLTKGSRIAQLLFQVAYDSSLICTSSPLDFVWYRCGDNSFTEAPDEIVAAFERQVYDVWGFAYPDTGISFPSISGMADTCPTNPNPIIDFQSSVLIIPCAGIFNYRGDINLNEIAYEIADYVLFSNYLVYGDQALTVQPSTQAAASDVNSDGVFLSLNDFIYLERVIVNDTVPASAPTKAVGDTVTLVQDLNNHTVAMQYPDSLTALWLLFDGELASVTSGLSNQLVGYNFDGTHTRVLIQPNLPTVIGQPLARFGDGGLFAYTGDAVLIGAEAAIDGVTTIPTDITLAGFQQCCATRGNVNHDAEQKIDIVDLNVLVQYMFSNGTAPSCLEEANVNGVGGDNLDIADLVYLLRYVFQNGDAPPACPTQTKSFRYLAFTSGYVVLDGIITMTVDDDPVFSGEWFTTQLEPSLDIGPQVGHGSWYGTGTGSLQTIYMCPAASQSQVELTLSNTVAGIRTGGWKHTESNVLVSEGTLYLFEL